MNTLHEHVSSRIVRSSSKLETNDLKTSQKKTNSYKNYYALIFKIEPHLYMLIWKNLLGLY